MNQIVLNIIIAFLWVLFQDEDHFKFSTFFSGYLIGLIVIYIYYTDFLVMIFMFEKYGWQSNL